MRAVTDADAAAHRHHRARPRSSMAASVPATGASISTTALSVSISATSSPALTRVAFRLQPGDDRAFADGQVAERHGDRLARRQRRLRLRGAAAGAAAAGAARRRRTAAAAATPGRAPVPGHRRDGRRAPPRGRRRSGRRRPASRARATARRDARSASVCRRPTGASSSSKASSFIAWASSAPMPHIAQPSSTTSRRCVLRDALDDGLDVERHDGAEVDHLAPRCPRPPASRPPPARDGTSWPAATMVRSRRPRARCAATPKGTKCSPSGTSPLVAKSALGSSMMHRVAGAERGLHQPLGVGRRRRHADDEPRHVREHRMIDAAVVRPGAAHRAGADAHHHRRVHLAVRSCSGASPPAGRSARPSRRRSRRTSGRRPCARRSPRRRPRRR